MISISGYNDLQVKMDSLATAGSKFFNNSEKLTIKDMIHLFEDSLSINTSMKPSTSLTKIDTYSDLSIDYYGSHMNHSYDATQFTNPIAHSISGDYDSSKIKSGGILNVSYNLTMQVDAWNGLVDWRSSEALRNLGNKQSDSGNYSWIDDYTAKNGILHVAGWHCTNEAYDYDYHFIILLNNSNKHELGRVSVVNEVRNDVANVYKNVYNSRYSGFSADFPVTSTDFYNHPLVVVSRYTNDPWGDSDVRCDYWSREFHVKHNDSKTVDLSNATVTLQDILADNNSNTVFNDFIKKDMTAGKTISVEKSFYYPTIPNLYNAMVEFSYISNSNYHVRIDIHNYQIVYYPLYNPKQWTSLSIFNKHYSDTYNPNHSFEPQNIRINSNKDQQISKGSLVFISFNLNLNSNQDSSTVLSSSMDIGLTIYYKDGSSVNAKFISGQLFNDNFEEDTVTMGFASDTIYWETVGGYFVSPTTSSIDYITVNTNRNGSDSQYIYFDRYTIINLKVDVVPKINLNDNVETLYDAYTNLAKAFNAYFKTTTPYTIDDMIEALSSGTHT